MAKEIFDFYNPTNLKSYNLDKNMRYQLNMLDTLDAFTRKHSENVANLTCRICEYLHLNESFTIYCTICAYLHDIGKMFIPPEILQKPGKLTNEEYEIMKKHTTIGYDMCMKDLNLRPFAAGPKYHHESLNGTGYPEGLTKKDIPIEGQIIRVADEYDAIVSKRQYKTHIGISDTLKILIANSKPHENIGNADALTEMSEIAKMGKINPRILKCLFKVVLDDIDYECYAIQGYINSLKEDLKRMKQIENYYEKMQNSKTKKKKNYYLEGMKMLFKPGENIDNFYQVYDEYKEAFKIRKANLDKLFDEKKIIKKMKV